MKILKLIAKNTLRHKLRTILTILGISIAVMALGFLRTIVTSWNAGVTASAVNRMITHHSVSIIFPLPYAYRDQIQKVPVNSSACESCSHAGATRIFLALVVDGEVGVDGGGFQTVDERRVLGTSFFRVAAHDHVAHGIYSHATGNITGQRATHAIGHNQHETFFTELEV